MKIKKVTKNNRKKCFEVTTSQQSYSFPYAKLSVRPTSRNPIKTVHVDPELGKEAFTYTLESGKEGSVHIDQVREYHQDPEYLKDLLLYRLTLEVQKRVAKSSLSKREMIRRLGTSATQFYRLLDQTNYQKSFAQLLTLLYLLDCEVQLVIKKKASRVGSM